MSQLSRSKQRDPRTVEQLRHIGPYARLFWPASNGTLRWGYDRRSRGDKKFRRVPPHPRPKDFVLREAPAPGANASPAGASPMKTVQKTRNVGKSALGMILVAAAMADNSLARLSARIQGSHRP
jgi:hypothetical protein